MLNHLKEKKDVGFFTSIAGLMNSCSVLDLDAFERNTKAEGINTKFQLKSYYRHLLQMNNRLKTIYCKCGHNFIQFCRQVNANDQLKKKKNRSEANMY